MTPAIHGERVQSALSSLRGTVAAVTRRRLPAWVALVAVAPNFAGWYLGLPAGNPLGKLHAIGVELALDDFGTGYSALNYLADLPFDVVKIDQGFVAGLEDDERVEALLGGILGLCRALDLHAIAGGIETEPQLA